MSSSYSTADLETRIAELEERLKKQDSKIRRLAGVTTIGFLALETHPFQDLFEVPEFEDIFDFIFEDFGACTNNCLARYKAQVAACDGDAACEQAALFERAACMDKCNS